MGGPLRITTAVFSVTAALFSFAFAVGGACTTVEPWGDSPRAFYASVADVGLALGLLFLLSVAHQLQQIESWRRFAIRAVIPICVLAAVAVAVPVWMSATNSLEASSIGEGGPPVAVMVAGGIGLGLGLAALMAKRIAVGVLTGGCLGILLLAAAFVTAR